MNDRLFQLNHDDYSLFNLLCRINVEHNYVGNILRLGSKGKSAHEEEMEDPSLIGAFVVRASNALSRRIKKYTQSRRSFATYQEILDIAQQNLGSFEKEIKAIDQLCAVPIAERIKYPMNRHRLPLDQRLELIENRLINLSKRSKDGATFFDDRVISKYVVIDSTLTLSQRGFNSIFGTFYNDFEDIIPYFIPKTFSHASGEGDIQMGSKSQNALGASLILSEPGVSEVESYLLKVTAYGTIGTGKVIRMFLDRSYPLDASLPEDPRGPAMNAGQSWLGRFVYEEFFLHPAKHLHSLKDAPLDPPSPLGILDPIRLVVGIFRRYETDLNIHHHNGPFGPVLKYSKYATAKDLSLRPKTIEALANSNGRNPLEPLPPEYASAES